LCLEQEDTFSCGARRYVFSLNAEEVNPPSAAAAASGEEGGLDHIGAAVAARVGPGRG